MKKSVSSVFIFVFVFCAGVLQASTDIKLNRNTDGYTFEYAVPQYRIQSVDQYGLQTSRSNEVYTSVAWDDYTHLSSDVGKPATPILQFELALYDKTCIPTIKISDVVEETLVLSSHLYPAQVYWGKSQPVENRPFSMDYNYYRSSGSRTSAVTIGDVTTMRDLTMVTVSVSPFFYSPSLKTLTVIKSMKIRFITPVNKKIKPCDSPTWENFYRFVCPNYNQIAEPARLFAKENYLIISAKKYTDGLKTFVEKKSAKYTVDLVTPDSTGTTTTAIQAFIKKRYNDAAKKPTYLLIVGQGSDIPLSSSSSTPTDFLYGSMTGKIKPDIFYGRFDVSTTEELNNMVTKTLFMENNLYDLQQTQKNAVLVGSLDADNGQVAEGTHNYCIQKYFSPQKFNTLKLYTNSDQTATKEKFIQALNDGVIWAIYSGHGQPTFWRVAAPNFMTFDSVDIKGLTNTKSFPFSAGHACYTGSFHQPVCFAEAFTRGKAGAVAYYGSSVMTDWTGDDNTQRGMFDAIVNKVYSYAAAFIAGLVKNNSSSYFKQYNLSGDPSLQVYTDATPVASTPVTGDLHEVYKLNVKNSTIIISYRGVHSIELLNPQGRLITKYSGSGAAQYTFPATLGCGIYLLRIETDKQSVVKIPVISK